jgi:glycosyltransferase involved in cell wall biosynthesis
MKILFVNHTASLTGAPISCFNIMTKLGEGFSPVFATRENGPLIDLLKESGIKYYLVVDKGFLGFKYISKFMKIIKSEGVNIVHLNTLTPFCKYAGIAGYLLRIPIVWVVRENPMISRSRRLRFWLKSLSSKIVFVDRDTKENLLPENRSDAEVIYNGVDTEAFQPFQSNFLFEKFNIDTAQKLIGYIGLVTKRKGLEYLIKAFPLIKERYARVKIIIIGGYKQNEEPYFSEIKSLIKRLNLESDIYFTGELSDVRYPLNNLDIVVLPSLEERCSRTLLESLACAKAVVATRVGGTPEIVDDRTNGFLIEPVNERQIADAVLRLLSDDELRQKMGMNGRRKVEKFFNIRENIIRMRKLYSDIGKRVSH